MTLEGPALAPAKLFRSQLAGQLVAQDEPLIDAQALGGPCQQTQLRAVLDELLDVGPHVGRLDAARLDVSKWQRIRECCLDAAASGERSLAVLDARVEPLAKAVGYVSVARERSTGSHRTEQLEHSLAVAVLELLPRQPPSVGAQERITVSARHERDFAEEVGPTFTSCRCRGVDMSAAGGPSGRHASMSVLASPRPPFQSAR